MAVDGPREASSRPKWIWTEEVTEDVADVTLMDMMAFKVLNGEQGLM